MSEVLFEVQTPISFRVRMTVSYWKRIVTMKHPVMQGHEEEVKRTLRDPEEIRRSKKDPTVYLFYREERQGRWICVMVKRLNDEGFVITTYPTDRIKEGERIWSR